MQELANPSSAQDLRASPIKEKRVSVFQLSTPSRDFEQCGTCNERGARSSPRSNRRASPIRKLVRACGSHKESQSGFNTLDFAFTGEGIKTLRTNKRKTAQPFFASRLSLKIPSSGRSRLSKN